MSAILPFTALIGLLLLATMAWAGYSLAPWVPTRKKDLARIVALVNPQPGEVIYDLGCGDGRVVLALARACPAATVIGVELAVPMYGVAKIRQRLAKTRNAHIRLGNVLHTDLTSADKLYMFVMPETLQKKLQPKFARELKPGTQIFSYTFSAKDWQPDQVNKPEPDRISIFQYTVPEKVQLDTHDV